MATYAHALIEDPRDGQRFQRGDELPADFPELDALVADGAASDEPYEATADDNPAPEEVVIDGVVYKRASDGADAGDDRA